MRRGIGGAILGFCAAVLLLAIGAFYFINTQTVLIVVNGTNETVDDVNVSISDHLIWHGNMGRDEIRILPWIAEAEGDLLFEAVVQGKKSEDRLGYVTPNLGSLYVVTLSPEGTWLSGQGTIPESY